MNRILNKTISLILTLVMCAGLLSVSPAFADETVKDEAALQAMEVLRLFGIIPEDYQDYNVNLDQSVSRADFAVAIAKLINATGSGSSDVYYYDVPETNWAFKEIGALTAQGILNGPGNRLFRPDDMIERNEAYKILLTILGYGDFAKYNGGYPAGYLMAAKRAGLTKGISSAVQVTRGEMFLMLYNAMTAEIFEPTAFGGESATYRAAKDKTLLSLYWDICYDEGTVTGVNGVDLYEGSIAKDKVNINGTDYKSDILMAEYLGEEVKFFYHYTQSTDERRIMWATPTGRTKLLNITADNDASFDKGTFTLTYVCSGSGRKQQVTLERSVVVVYNGGIVSTNIDDIFNEARYTAKLINNGGGYNVAVVRAYENILVNAIDTSSKTVYDKIDSGKNLVLDENLYEFMMIQSAGGIDAEVSEIAANYVLSVYMSKDKSCLEVQISASQISGKVDTIYADGNDYTVMIGGTGYRMPKSKQKLILNPGDNVILYLDVMGEIAGYDYQSESDALYAWIVQYAIVDGLDPTLKLQLFTENNELIVADVVNKVRVDGETCKTAEDAVKALALGNEGIKDQLVRIRLRDGEVNYIDTLYEGSEANGLFVSSPMSTNMYMGASVLGPNIRADVNTKVFVVPKSNQYKTERKAYTVTTMSAFFTSWINYMVEGYRSGEKEKPDFTDVVVVQEDLLGTGKNTLYQNIMIIAGENMVWDEENGTAVPQLVTQSGASTLEYKCADGYTLDGDPNIKVGNVITITTNKQGELASTTLLYGTTKGETPTEKKDTYAVPSWTSEDQTACGYITGLSNGLATLALEPGGKTVLLMPTNVGVAVYDPRQSESVFVGGTGDLADAMYNNYKVVLSINRGTMRSFAVVKE